MDNNQLTSVYRLIAELFLYPESRDQDLIEAEVAALAGASAELLSPIEAFLATPASSSVEEYISTLELAPPVPLYLGAHLFEEPESCRGAGMSGRNAYMLELSNIYRHFGVEHDSHELADFVPVIIEFLGLSLIRQDEDQIGLRRYLIETLLLNGIESLLSALRKYESPYVFLVESLRVALAQDIRQMAGGPKWHPPAKERSPETAADVRALMADNRAAPENWVEL